MASSSLWSVLVDEGVGEDGVEGGGGADETETIGADVAVVSGVGPGSVSFPHPETNTAVATRYADNSCSFMIKENTTAPEHDLGGSTSYFGITPASLPLVC
ncbi:MAG: hypothetical protein Q4P23_15550 [Micrococcaceae bacterium]|nr:hypothetical protein [Micrococcaceae bacterium]